MLRQQNSGDFRTKGMLCCRRGLRLRRSDRGRGSEVADVRGHLHRWIAHRTAFSPLGCRWIVTMRLGRGRMTSPETRTRTGWSRCPAGDVVGVRDNRARQYPLVSIIIACECRRSRFFPYPPAVIRVWQGSMGPLVHVHLRGNLRSRARTVDRNHRTVDNGKRSQHSATCLSCSVMVVVVQSPTAHFFFPRLQLMRPSAGA